MTKNPKKHQAKKYENPPITLTGGFPDIRVNLPLISNEQLNFSHIADKFLLHLKLWKWSAIHHQDFQYFEIAFTKIIRTSVNYSPYSNEFFSMEIALRKSFLYYFIPATAESEFCKAYELPDDTFDDGIPF